ncbi:NUDIX hydrolase [Aliikangiella marina]|uniref:Phosphatase NudJ n=1 Tax=Aliikangiella marina TaxID=1712262 RepID=A0A545TI82_9GAMM|nr:NUDIX hydrolase [Aliikangiella marina]TQV76925.1 NUDIX hydrolase [Aliikangiella marina]
MDYIHVTVAAIIRRNDKYLLVKETASSGQIVYNQPAGHVELKESLIDAVIREVHEETGLDFRPTALLGTYLLSPAINGKTYLRFCFVGDVPVDQEASPNDPDIIDNCWFTVDEILALPEKSIRSALVLKCIEDFKKGIRLPLESLTFGGDELGMYYQSRDVLGS